MTFPLEKLVGLGLVIDLIVEYLPFGRRQTSLESHSTYGFLFHRSDSRLQNHVRKIVLVMVRRGSTYVGIRLAFPRRISVKVLGF